MSQSEAGSLCAAGREPLEILVKIVSIAKVRSCAGEFDYGNALAIGTPRRCRCGGSVA